MKDLYIIKAYSSRHNQWARFIVGHSSEDMACDLVLGQLPSTYVIRECRLVCPLMAEQQPFCEEI